MRVCTRITAVFLLAFACLPVLADDCPAIRSFSANDSQTGEPVTFTWSYSGASPQTQTLSGHDFSAPVILGSDARSYTYTPAKPGMKHAQLDATTSCGTVSTSAKYQVKQCNVVAPPLSVDQTSVAPGAVINASVPLEPGHTVRWEVINGTASATTGSAIQVTAGGPGTVTINAWVSRGSSCSVLSTATVEVVAACAIAEPVVFHDTVAIADAYFPLWVESVGPGETFTFAVHDAQIIYQDATSLYVQAPSAGSFSIDLIVTNGTCSRTFTYAFTVEACHASATVRPGQTGSCGATTAVVEFTGTAPFQGEWSDGQYFYTWESALERPISGGTYSVVWVYDRFCFGTVSGSAAGSSLAAPSFTIDEYVNGNWWGFDTCPGTPRTATLNGEIPAGATLEWSIPGGTILSGQGTPVVQFAGGEIGPTRLTAVFHDAQGCSSAPSIQQWGNTMSAPQPVVTVEPSTISAGGTAVVTVEFLSYFTGGWGLTSSLGDSIVPLGGNSFEYRSTHGSGVATITVDAGNVCASGSATTTLTIDGSNPVQATARVRSLGNDCASYGAYAEFTGVSPFRGTWSHGETFVTDDPYYFLTPSNGGTYTLVEFSDANGPGTVTGSATFDFVALPRPVISFSVEETCPNATVTATLDTPVPEGGVVTWYVFGGEIVSGDGTPTITVRAADTSLLQLNASVTAPGACSPYGHESIPIRNYVQEPRFDLAGLYVGTSTTFDVYLDANTATWGYENAFGDTMEVIANPQPNVYTIRYTSTHGFGESMIRVWGTTHCGASFEASRPILIRPPAPTVTLSSVPGETCGALITATFTGTAPFTGTWWDGQTFTTNESAITRFLGLSEFVWIQVSDANGDVAGSALDVQVARPDYIAISGPSQMCLGEQVTVTADLPAGWTIQWRVSPDPYDQSYGLRIVSGETSASVVVEGTIAELGLLNPVIKTSEGCVNFQSHYINVTPVCESQ